MIKQIRISTSLIENIIYICNACFVVPHLTDYISTSIQQEKQVKISYIIIGQDINTLMNVQEKLRKNPKSKQYNATVTNIEKKEYVESYIEKIEMVNGNQYENNYVQLMKKVQKNIELEMIGKYCTKEFEWDEKKAINFVQKEKINTFEKFLSYPNYSLFEEKKIKFIKNLIKQTLN